MSNCRGLLGRVVKDGYIAALMGALVYGAYTLHDMNLEYWQKLIALPGQGLLHIVIGSIIVAILLDAVEESLGHLRYPWLAWRLFSQNINFLPLNYRLLQLPFLTLLLFNLPALAWVEEFVFRHDLFIHPTKDWYDAAWRSIVFGVIHIAAGIRVRTVVPLTLAGLWLSQHYMSGGIDQATLAHLVINTTGLGMLLITWARTGLNPMKH